jgi:acid phosphatase type 7
VYCAKGASPVSPTSAALDGPSPAIGSGALVGAGDIGFCGTPGAEATARLLDRLSGTVFTAGDNAYVTGTRTEFQNCYAPSWGRHLARTRPVAGNHEYGSGASAYFEYFGDNAGPSGAGYYSYAVGPWSVISLNSEIPAGPGSAQMMWLRNELSSRRSFCTAAIWHRPLFSSGRNGDNPDMRDVWRTLYEFHADLVINGHDHSYERFAPQDPDGRFDPALGIREFVVGTGGAPLYEFSNMRPNSEVRASVWGVGAFTLTGSGYQWEFVPVDGASFRDSGAGSCH